MENIITSLIVYYCLIGLFILLDSNPLYRFIKKRKTVLMLLIPFTGIVMILRFIFVEVKNYYLSLE